MLKVLKLYSEQILYISFAIVMFYILSKSKKKTDFKDSLSYYGFFKTYVVSYSFV